ncbi:MAG: UDP-N-acetylmuramoyl-L-alanyl-D-glutamate--2,6-diaminopimelate ligase [Bacteroidetes bacterium]|nr:MAG: UDP-N-acetylmuramoyl-L-alanyl-D-glutamate--2,6-diaminopimelate ligase [Bacteroidota bacterium]
MKLLKDILEKAGVKEVSGSVDIEIHSLKFDSRTVERGCLYFAVKGTTSDGHQFIPDAVRSGAVAVVCEKIPENPQGNVAFILVNDSGYAKAIIASNFYGNPSSLLNLVGVTGTNGKTTTVTLLHQLFQKPGTKAGLISTIQNKIQDRNLATTHTTPDPVQLNELLAQMVVERCTHCFMEVSSHALVQHRVAGLTFRGGIFTNLTHDHLDYHKTFDAYLKAKKTFFDDLPGSAFALINKDDRNGRMMVQNTNATVSTYSMQSMADFRCRILENQFQGLHLSMDGTDCWFRLIGNFNAYNLLAVYATAVLLGEERQNVLTQLSLCEPVDGRFNYIRTPNTITAIVDYAHTPDALQNVLGTIQSIRTHKEKIITVVGAGGNRDAAKRPVMAKIACNLSDKVILTSDNPRFEEPESILDDMKKGIEPQFANKVLVIVNRKEAIKTACALAKPGDIILVAGKGHETYQEIKGVKYPFDDKMVLKEVLEAGVE